MRMKTCLTAIAILVVPVCAAALLYQPVIRPWHIRWGASDAEAQMALLGDEIAGKNASQTTRAIDVRASASQIWPWIQQLGQGRGGLFSYDALENLVGCDIHTLDQIVPELQELKVGDTIRIGQQSALPYYHVVLLEPQKALVLRSVDPKTGEEKNATWGFYLDEKSSSLSRLIIRHRDEPATNPVDKIANGVFDPISFVMERRMLFGLREHAEGK